MLKNNGYNLAHNFGHRKKYLARIFAAMNLLAFAFDTTNDCLETLWQKDRALNSSSTSEPSPPTSSSLHGKAS